jgi:hypothetical protein
MNRPCSPLPPTSPSTARAILAACGEGREDVAQQDQEYLYALAADRSRKKRRLASARAAAQAAAAARSAARSAALRTTHAATAVERLLHPDRLQLARVRAALYKRGAAGAVREDAVLVHRGPKRSKLEAS